MYKKKNQQEKGHEERRSIKHICIYTPKDKTTTL